MAQQHLILLHGFLENTKMWDDLLRLISKKKFIIHTPHLPGHHGSQPILNSYKVQDYCDALMQQIPIGASDESFIIGHSMGGYLASSLVFQMPGKVKGLCLLHAKCGADDQEKIQQRKRAIDAAQVDKNLYVRTMINGQYSPLAKTNYATLIEGQIKFAQSLSWETIAECQNVMIHRPDQIAAMRDRSFPLYYFIGQNDHSVPMPIVLSEKEQLPGSLVHIEEGIGHMGHWEATRNAAAFINRILFAAFDEQDR
jgi:pimeloyl-ACP methyl ester carboxylesterase